MQRFIQAQSFALIKYECNEGPPHNKIIKILPKNCHLQGPQTCSIMAPTKRSTFKWHDDGELPPTSLNVRNA